MAFAPWLKTYDFDNDIQLFIPPSGVVAGMMAKVDREYDPWWVPAGLNRGRVNVLGLQAYYSLADRDELDAVQVNCFVRKPGVIALWNNRTLQTQESYFSFVEVRRLTNYIKKNVCKFIDAFLFEPLTDFTRERLVATLREFFDSIQRRMGILRYAVISDPLGTGNNPPAQVDQGILTVEVYYVPVRAIRGIWLKAIVTRFGYQIEERAGGA
jgi:phage tail sheath protein FI